jgi:sialidase-1
MRILIKYILIFTSFTFYSQNLEFVDLFDNSMNSEVFCYRIPSLVTTTNGTLIAAIDERNNSCGDLKWNRDINIVIRKSFDDGKTWTKIEKIVDYPLGKSASDPSMIVDKKTNEIFLFLIIWTLIMQKIFIVSWLSKVLITEKIGQNQLK